MTRDEILDLLVECSRSLKTYCKVFFPHRFPLPFSPWIHDQIFPILDDDNERLVLYEAARGTGKTEILHIGLGSNRALFRKSPFIVHLSCTADLAADFTGDLKAEYETNETIRKIFGGVQSKTWAKDDLVVQLNGKQVTRHYARGSGQQVRGLKWRANRPHTILCDDMEDSESVMSDDQRHKLKRWFRSDLMKSVDSSKNWRIFLAGTPLHEDSLVVNLRDAPEWTKVRLPMCDDNFRSLWPEKQSDENILAEVEGHREDGTLDLFYSEKMCEMIGGPNRAFKQEYFQYYTDSEFELNNRLVNIVLLDPAKSNNPESADSAIVGVGVDVYHHRIYVRDVVVGKMMPDTLQQEAFDMCLRLNAFYLGVETVSLGWFITWPLQNQILLKGLPIQMVELKAGTAKDAKFHRVKALIQFYRRGWVFHNKARCSPLELQLMSYPKPKKWDVMDAFAYIVQFLDRWDFYFSGTDQGKEEYEKEVFNAVTLPSAPPLYGWRTV